MPHSAFELFSDYSYWIYLYWPCKINVGQQLFSGPDAKGQTWESSTSHCAYSKDFLGLQAVLGHSYCVLYIPQFKRLKQSKDRVIAHHSEMVSWHKMKEKLHTKTCCKKAWSLNTHACAHTACTNIDGGRQKHSYLYRLWDIVHSTCYPPNSAQTTSKRTLNHCPAYKNASKYGQAVV